MKRTVLCEGEDLLLHICALSFVVDGVKDSLDALSVKMRDWEGKRHKRRKLSIADNEISRLILSGVCSITLI
jgi:hypothetical protein